MVNQQLIDYIKQQLEQGISFEAIIRELLTNGWQRPDLEEAFRIVNTNNNGNQIPRKVNIKKMITKGILGIFVGLILGFIGLVIHWIVFLVIWILTIILFGFWGAKSKTKEELQEELQHFVVSVEGLTKNEKIAAWIFSIINPVITGAIMYYMWRKRYPTKAKKANNISMIVFLVEFVLGILIAVTSKQL